MRIMDTAQDRSAELTEERVKDILEGSFDILRISERMGDQIVDVLGRQIVKVILEEIMHIPSSASSSAQERASSMCGYGIVDAPVHALKEILESIMESSKECFSSSQVNRMLMSFVPLVEKDFREETMDITQSAFPNAMRPRLSTAPCGRLRGDHERAPGANIRAHREAYQRVWHCHRTPCESWLCSQMLKELVQVVRFILPE